MEVSSLSAANHFIVATSPSKFAVPKQQVSLGVLAHSDTDKTQLNNSITPAETTSSSNSETSSESNEKSAEFTQAIEQLKSRDAQVRAHEQAHVAAGGAYVTGGPSYTYQTGPDGKQYAVGGSVNIDTSPISGDPEATLQKALVVQGAALAPVDPSSQDRAIAAQAAQMATQARRDMLDQNLEGQNSSFENANAQAEDSEITNTTPPSQISERVDFESRLVLQA